ncbi:MAG: reverse transcriptase domain-containing protein [Desulfosporosinus sp.]|nr:reverse transcriptase domain-containing protein [Desulfosporosinus sp.]
MKKLHKVQKETGNGNIAKAFMILSSDSTYQDAADPEVKAKLLEIFKPEDPTKSTNGRVTFNFPLTKAIVPKDVKNAIAKDKNSAPGPSGWSFKLLKVVAKSTTSQTLLASLLNRILHQDCPLQILSCLRDGLLTVLDKPNGGVRPTVSSDAFLKLLARSIGNSEQEVASAPLAPIQAGVGLKSGSEFVVHTVRMLLHTHPDWGCLQADMSHAYDSISLAAIQKELRKISRERVHLMATYFDLFVAKPRELRTRGDHRFTVHQGVIQGDPLSPFFFSLGTQPILADIQRDLKVGRVFAYLDDVFIVGPMDKILDLFDIFKQRVQTIGLNVNMVKTKVLNMKAEPVIEPTHQEQQQQQQQHDQEQHDQEHHEQQQQQRDLFDELEDLDPAIAAMYPVRRRSTPTADEIQAAIEWFHHGHVDRTNQNEVDELQPNQQTANQPQSEQDE